MPALILHAVHGRHSYRSHASSAVSVTIDSAVLTTTVLADASAMVANRRASRNAFAPVGSADAITTTANATPDTPTACAISTTNDGMTTRLITPAIDTSRRSDHPVGR